MVRGTITVLIYHRHEVLNLIKRHSIEWYDDK
jgi:hypothetical protein